jgi:hypothetical protein
MARRKSHQITVRLSSEADMWLQQRANDKTKGEVLRGLVDKQMKEARQAKLLDMFNRAAADLTEADRKERRALLAAFAAFDE